MQFLDGQLIVSPSDLTGFLECEHLTQQELAAARGEIERPERKDPELEVLTRRGLEHEARHLAELRTGHRRVVEFPFPEGTITALAQAHAQTVAAMSDGTRDQLFLAFRLASLENYAASTEPLRCSSDGTCSSCLVGPTTRPSSPTSARS